MRRTAALITGAIVLVAAGCGESESYSNDPRPPSPIVLTASINKDAVSVSPTSFGAGPVSLVITNQTSAAQEITFGTSGGSAGFEQQTGPINPGDTATLKAVVPRGSATVKVQSDGIDPAELKIGAERASAQNELLQP
ncbi:MAG: hypothetical protein H0V81_09120 [Solirubrobacterales bacterium]|nr:hypothetical protein [Solirubrobacterales bacterium]